MSSNGQQRKIVDKSASAAALTQIKSTTWERPKVGQRGHFEMSLVAEAGEKQLKSAVVSCSIPGYSSFTLTADEGTTYYGDDSAPPPLAYFSAGIAFCLLTHLQALVHAHGLAVRSIRIEQRLQYSTTLATTMATGAAPDGRCDGLETHVLIDSDEPADKIQRLVAHSEAACMAHQTVLRPTPATLRVLLNGSEIDQRRHNAASTHD
ncbi:MAG TPA: OsmC family protein [Steroidobacteraceae bacterium]|nr:OsmC family protein [Steroidobacteraceae bacterium]